MLEGALVRAANGRGSIALISGEPGIGKTRLLEEAAKLADDRDFVVAWGRGWELGSAPTYWPWIEVLRVLFASGLECEETARDVARLLPELGTHAKSRGSETRPSDEFELCDAVASYLRAASLHKSLLLLFDDLHAADPSSLALAEFVARQIRDARVCLLGTHRDVEARLAPAVEASLARLGRSGDVITLRRLEVGDVEAMVREKTGHSDSQASQMIFGASEGNPLFVHELIELLNARGASRSGGVPSGVKAVIRERLALLTPATVALLQAAAIVGREFSPKIAAEVAGVTPEALDDAASEAIESDLLEQAGGGRLRFSHALVAETLSLDLVPRVRASLHRRAAEILERIHRDDPTAPLSDIPNHWLQAGSEYAERAADAAARGAAVAIRRLAFEDAAALYDRALEALSVAAPEDAKRRASLMIGAVEAWAHCGDRSKAERLALACADLARSLGDADLFARGALALEAGSSIGKADPVVIQLLEEGLSLLPARDGSVRARVMARLASAQQPAKDPFVPVALARDAIAMARRLAEPAVLLEVIHSAMGALMDYAPAAERAPLNEEVVRLAAAAGDRPRGLRARMRLAFDRIELADVAGFEEAVALHDALANETPQPRYQWVAPMFRSMQALWEGRFAEAERLESRARDIWSQATIVGPPPAPARALGYAVQRDDPELLHQAVEKYLSLYGDFGVGPILRAYASAKANDTNAAAKVIPQLLSPEAAFLVRDIHGLELMSEIAWATRSRPLAEHLYPPLLAHAGRPFMVTGIAFSMQGLVDHALFRLAAVRGDFVAADEHAQAALSRCSRFRARPLAALVDYDWATILIERGGADAAVRARELLVRACKTAEELHMAYRAERCHELLARLEATTVRAEDATAVTAAAPAGNQGPLRLELEGEYWTIAGFGELCRIRDGRGMRMLAELLANPGADKHVLELSGVTEAVDGGDAGEVIDRDARSAYQARLRELTEEIEEARQWNDLGRAERLEEEADALRRELTRAAGLSGRERRAGSVVERARVNVRRRIALVIRRIEETAPKLGAHLAASIRTGVQCSYRPGT